MRISGTPPLRNKARASSARSLPNAGRFRRTTLLLLVHFLGLIVTVSVLGCYIVDPVRVPYQALVGALVINVFTWLLDYAKRRSTLCPLCKGTPLINSGAHPHVRAWHLRFFNHGISAALSILFTHKFRCMYCGTDFDLLKPRSRHLTGSSENGGKSRAR